MTFFFFLFGLVFFSVFGRRVDTEDTKINYLSCLESKMKTLKVKGRKKKTMSEQICNWFKLQICNGRGTYREIDDD